ncbi:MAG: TraM recognition domain-containing protein, partial [bacterium]
IRTKREKSGAYRLTFLQVKVPSENEIEIKAAEQMFSGLMGFGKGFFAALFTGQYRIAFEIVSKGGAIGFYVVVPDDLVSLVEKQINGAYPEAEIDIIDPTEVWDRGACTLVSELKLASPSYYPIKVHDEMGADPLASLTTAMSKTGPEEVLAVQFVISPAGEGWRKAGQAFCGGIKNKSAEGKGYVDPEFVKGVEKKLSHPGFDVAIRVIAVSNDKPSATTNLRNLTASFEQFTDVKYNKFKKRRFIVPLKLIDDFIYRRLTVRDLHVPFLDISLYRNCSILNTQELATIFHLPSKEVRTPGIIWLISRRASAPVDLPASGLYLGQSIFRGVKKKVYMLPEDRVRHTYIIGQTGTGKSQLLMSMVLQDIQNGEGVAVVDPHGSDISELLEKIPPHRVDDVIVFDAGDTERPMGLNMLEAESEEEKHLIINAFIASLYKLYDPNRQGIMGPKLERAIRNVMLTAMMDKESTMVDVLRLLIDKRYADSFLPKITDPLVKKYWVDEMAHTTEQTKGEQMGYFVSKFDRFVTEKVMRNIVGQPKSAFNFRKVMAEKKILLCDLSKGKIGEENSNFLGLLIVPKILGAALNRSSMVDQGVDFPHFYLYVDEFQNFATDDFATILSEARKYKLDLIVAHQFIAQLPDKIKEAVFGNVGTTCCFRVGADDAKYLETQFEPVFKQSDLMNNPTGSYYLRLLVNNQPSPPFSVSVDWEMITNTKRDRELARRIREHSRMTYGKPEQEVEAFITKRLGPVAGAPESDSPKTVRMNPFGPPPSPFGSFGGSPRPSTPLSDSKSSSDLT